MMKRPPKSERAEASGVLRSVGLTRNTLACGKAISLVFIAPSLGLKEATMTPATNRRVPEGGCTFPALGISNATPVSPITAVSQLSLGLITSSCSTHTNLVALPHHVVLSLQWDPSSQLRESTPGRS